MDQQHRFDKIPEVREILKRKWLLFFRFLDQNADDILSRSELESLSSTLSEYYGLQDLYKRDLYNGIVGWWNVIKQYYGNNRVSVTSDEFVYSMMRMYREQKAALVGYSKEFARVIFDTMDLDSDGQIAVRDYADFFSVIGYNNFEFLNQVFNELDQRRKGILRRRQFQRAVVIYNISDDIENSHEILFAFPENN